MYINSQQAQLHNIFFDATRVGILTLDSWTCPSWSEVIYIYIVGCHVLNVALILLPVSADGFDLAPLTMPEISVYVRASRF